MMVESPDVRQRDFKNLDAALDFARFSEPYWMSIEKILLPEGVVYKMNYQGSIGDL